MNNYRSINRLNKMSSERLYNNYVLYTKFLKNVARGIEEATNIEQLEILEEMECIIHILKLRYKGLLNEYK